MFLALGAAITLHATSPLAQQPRREPATVVRDSTPRDSIKRRAPQRRPVTAEALRSAFHDERARDLLGRARRARLSQDSSLKSYDARVRERLTARMAIGQRGPDRIMYRQESAFHVQWRETVGAHVDVTGARVGIPIAPPEAQHEALEEKLGERCDDADSLLPRARSDVARRHRAQRGRRSHHRPAARRGRRGVLHVRVGRFDGVDAAGRTLGPPARD